VKRLGALVFGAVVLISACGGGAGQPTPAGTPAATVQLVARGSAFDKNRLDVPADAAFAIDFNNTDAVPHNVSIHGNGSARTTDTFSGPAERTFVLAALPAGTYTFQCDVHPNMTGTFVVGGSASN
jgi:plastocyanin